jgi:hypothetical protein
LKHPAAGDFQIVFPNNPGLARIIRAEDTRWFSKSGISGDMLSLLRARFSTAGLRNMQQMLGQGDCIENQPASLRFLRFAFPEF